MILPYLPLYCSIDEYLIKYSWYLKLFFKASPTSFHVFIEKNEDIYLEATF